MASRRVKDARLPYSVNRIMCVNAGMSGNMRAGRAESIRKRMAAAYAAIGGKK